MKKEGLEKVKTTPIQDGGIDVEAYDPDKELPVFVQCKCWSLKHTVGRDVIDELIGKITRFKNVNNIKPLGIVATTTRFFARCN